MKHFVVILMAAVCLGSSSLAAQDIGRVVVYRPKRFTGSGLTPSVYIDDRQVARLDNGRFVSFALPVGKHSFQSSMKHDPLKTDVKGDETLYLEMVILPGNWRGGGRLVPVSEEEAKRQLLKLKPLDAKWIMASELLWKGPPESPPAQ